MGLDAPERRPGRRKKGERLRLPGAPPTGASGATAARCGSHRGLLGETEDVERHAGRIEGLAREVGLQ